jgi:two-component system sensor histidine kinase VanS
MGWLYYYMTHIWNRIGPGSGGRIELPRIVLFLIGFGLPVAVWFLYTILFLQKPLRYLDDLLGATAQLAADKEQPIVLPDVCKEAENELNEVRLQAILDERRLLENEEKKNNLIMYLAHDLKTPLTSVLGYLVLLEENPDLSAEQRAKYIGIARNKAERLEELIGEFFDITRLTLTTMTLNRSQVHLSRMLEQIVSESEPLLVEKGVHWQADIMPDVYIEGDADDPDGYGFAGLPVTKMEYDYAALAATAMLNGEVDYVIVDNAPANAIAKSING